MLRDRVDAYLRPNGFDGESNGEEGAVRASGDDEYARLVLRACTPWLTWRRLAGKDGVEEGGESVKSIYWWGRLVAICAGVAVTKSCGG